jgi:hypothetical protein
MLAYRAGDSLAQYLPQHQCHDNRIGRLSSDRYEVWTRSISIAK